MSVWAPENDWVGDEMGGEVVQIQIHKNTYRDSVELMRVAAEIEGQPGVTRAALVTGTPANRAVLSDAGLLEGDAQNAGPNDLVIAVASTDQDSAISALAHAADLLKGQAPETSDVVERLSIHTLSDGLIELPSANLSLISTPGTYATAEALKALKRGLHVFLFSDNVPLADEIELKRMASKKGLLLMGPDCGTAILDGVPLGFANVVRRGRIGMVGASGTGLQQVSCLIDRLGEGVSQVIGVGGRDLDVQVGGVMMLAAMNRLAADPGTSVIVLLSKPPSPDVARLVLASARECPKPVVVNFLGGDPDAVRVAGAIPAETLEDAAVLAVALASGNGPRESVLNGKDGDMAEVARTLAKRLSSGQYRVRGLYSGGTLAYEAKLILAGILGEETKSRSQVVDLGDDEYTVGRPHPMIDPRLRNEQIIAAAKDPTTAVILLDVVLGYASHPDPAGVLLPVLAEAREIAEREGRQPVVVASVCGTESDPQGLRLQEERLSGAGVLLAQSNARAARLAATIALGVECRREGSSLTGETIRSLPRPGVRDADGAEA